MLARERMQAFRESKALSRSALARLVGFSPSYVGLVERGLRQPSETFRRRLETLTADLKPRPIRADEWIDAGAFELPSTQESNIKRAAGAREVRR